MTDANQLILGELANGPRTHSAITVASMRRGVAKQNLLEALNGLLEAGQIIQRIKAGGVTYALANGSAPAEAPPPPPAAPAVEIAPAGDSEEEDDDLEAAPEVEEGQGEPPAPGAPVEQGAGEPDPEDGEWMSLREAAMLLRLTVSGVHRAVRLGRIVSRHSKTRRPGVLGRTPREVLRSSVEAYAAVARPQLWRRPKPPQQPDRVNILVKQRDEIAGLRAQLESAHGRIRELESRQAVPAAAAAPTHAEHLAWALRRLLPVWTRHLHTQEEILAHLGALLDEEPVAASGGHG